MQFNKYTHAHKQIKIKTRSLSYVALCFRQTPGGERGIKLPCFSGIVSSQEYLILNIMISSTLYNKHVGYVCFCDTAEVGDRASNSKTERKPTITGRCFYVSTNHEIVLATGCRHFLRHQMTASLNLSPFSYQ